MNQVDVDLIFALINVVVHDLISKGIKNDRNNWQIPLTLSSSCWDKVVKTSSGGFPLSVVSDLFVGRTRAIDGYCCCWDWKSICNPTGMGGSSNKAGCGIDNDVGGGGIITKINFILWK